MSSSSVPKTYHPVKWKPLYGAMARSIVFQNMANVDLAEKYGISPNRVSQITNSPLFQAELKRLQVIVEDKYKEHYLEEELSDNDINEGLKGLRQRAVEVLAEDLYSMVQSAHRSRMALQLLDRTGSAPRQLQPQQDNRRLTIMNFVPQPGDDPSKAREQLEEIRKIVKDIEEKDTGDDL